MNSQQLRQALWAIAVALVTFVAVRRWRMLTAAAPRSTQQSDELVVPLPADGVALTLDDEPSTDDVEIAALDDVAAINDRGANGDDDEHDDEWETQTRKVSRDRRIKYHGQRYGPLPETLVGQRVLVDVVGDTLQASYDGQIVASFHLHEPHDQ